jgi:hypothetical protein
MLGKNKKGEKITEIKSFDELYGNKRELVVKILNIAL